MIYKRINARQELCADTRTLIPTPKLIINDHKKKDRNNNFPTRLVVPATNSTATFPKIGHI